MRSTQWLCLLFVIPVQLYGSPTDKTKQTNRIPVEPTPWRTDYDIIDGWDWSLPPGIKPIPYSGITMPWPRKNGKQYDLPGNEVTIIRTTWRELEPEEGNFEFKSLRQQILDTSKVWDGTILHVLASVWEIKDFPGHPTAKYPTNWLEGQKRGNESAPHWLEKYNIPKKPGRPRLNLTTPFQIINLDIFNDEYHSRYLKFVEAFGKSGIPQMKEVMFCYLHMASGNPGSFMLGQRFGANSYILPG